MADDRFAAVAVLVLDMVAAERLLDGMAVQSGYETPNRRPSTNGGVKVIDVVGAGEARGDKGAVGSSVGAVGTVKFIGEAMPVEVGVVGAMGAVRVVGVMEVEVREAEGMEGAVVVEPIEFAEVEPAGVTGVRGGMQDEEAVGMGGTVVVIGAAVVISVAGAKNSNIARASAAVIFAVTQLWSLP
ncbi:hypothetical protein K440DRAFT_643718 [Wilcoxina mikolae CBS 423.85]|nr:hypothetical protein K440DRAFT_643718 [Wilcoxina mikolae CBS 423.85]